MIVHDDGIDIGDETVVMVTIRVVLTDEEIMNVMAHRGFSMSVPFLIDKDTGRALPCSRPDLGLAPVLNYEEDGFESLVSQIENILDAG